MINALSIDVEDWFQVSDFEDEVHFTDWDKYEPRVVQNTRRLLALLATYKVRATFFILTWNAERFPDLVREIDAAGHEVATHGYAHRLVYTQTPQEFRADLERSLHILQQVTKKPVLGYRAPSFSITKDSLWALDILLDLGLRYDASIFPLQDKLYGIPDSDRFPFAVRSHGERTLVEFPMSTVQMFGRNFPFSGGAYFRLLPYPVVRWAMRALNRQRQAVMFYLHPWEIDHAQPRLTVRGKRGYSSHYLNLRQTEKKLVRLLGDFAFAPIRETLALSSSAV